MRHNRKKRVIHCICGAPYAHEWGFTLLEIIIAVTILVVIMGTATPLIVNYYANYQIITTQHDLLSILRKAQSLAIANQYESQFGVSIDSDKYILFRGPSYASRTTTFDEEISYSGAISISGPTEIAFNQLSGRPSATGTISLTSKTLNKSININDEGRINW